MRQARGWVVCRKVLLLTEEALVVHEGLLHQHLPSDINTISTTGQHHTTACCLLTFFFLGPDSLAGGAAALCVTKASMAPLHQSDTRQHIPLSVTHPPAALPPPTGPAMVLLHEPDGLDDLHALAVAALLACTHHHAPAASSADSHLPHTYRQWGLHSLLADLRLLPLPFLRPFLPPACIMLSH